jgi:molybdate transport system ATP-binding protein
VDQVMASLGGQGDEAGVLLMGQVAERDAAHHLVRVAFAGGGLWLRDDGLPLGQAVRVRVLARDVSLTLNEPRDTSIQNHWPGQVLDLSPGQHPSQLRVSVRCGPTVVLAHITTRAQQALALSAGSAVWVQVKSAALAR